MLIYTIFIWLILVKILNKIIKKIKFCQNTYISYTN